MKKILVIFGTRPEAIKMAPVIKTLKKNFNIELCISSQHKEILHQVLDLFELKPDYDLDIMIENQDLFDITTNILNKFKSVIDDSKPDMIMVHGDTSTTFASSLCAFYNQIMISHVEAGLRTNKKYSPFPEEINRQLTSKLTDIHFAPTEAAKSNLISEGINEAKIFVTGNTIVDAMQSILQISRNEIFDQMLVNNAPVLNEDQKDRKIILVTCHRRENFGEGIINLCNALKETVKRRNDIDIIFSVHPNPNVQEVVNKNLHGYENIYLIKPTDYITFVKLMDVSYLILTDSGGIQEEAPSLNKPVLVMRNDTERPEALETGTAKLIKINKDEIVRNIINLIDNKKEYKLMTDKPNPYGDGFASDRISDILLKLL